jgi:hypothetical protein
VVFIALFLYRVGHLLLSITWASRGEAMPVSSGGWYSYAKMHGYVAGREGVIPSPLQKRDEIFVISTSTARRNLVFTGDFSLRSK